MSREDDLVVALNAQTPPAIETDRQAEPGRRMFGASAFDGVVRRDAFEGSLLPDEQRTTAVHNLRDILADTGIAPVDAGVLLRDNTQDARPQEQQIREVRKRFATTFGNGAEQALAGARAYVARDPRLGRVLETNGLGNDPDALLTLARIAKRKGIK